MGTKKKSTASPRRSTPKDKIQLPPRQKGAPAGANSIAAREAELRQAELGQAASPDSGLAGSDREAAAYYRLNTRAVEDLVTANEENSPPVSRAELRKYQSGPKVKVADWVKALILKWWAGGMICYFFIWGLSTFTMNPWDHLAVLGLALGLVTNLIVNNIFRFIAREEGAYDRWMMFPGKKLYFLPLDVLYGLLLVACAQMTYNGLNLLLAGSAAESSPALGVEPIGFGIILTLWDLLFLGMKHLGRRILSDAKRQAGGRP